MSSYLILDAGSSFVLELDAANDDWLILDVIEELAIAPREVVDLLARPFIVSLHARVSFVSLNPRDLFVSLDPRDSFVEVPHRSRIAGISERE